MTQHTWFVPAESRVYSGTDRERYLALVLETLVHDVSPAGDENVADQLGGYTLGEQPPPDSVPQFVTLEDGYLTVSNPPFLMGTIEIIEANEFGLRLLLDSNLTLLIDPPVEITLDSSFPAVTRAAEQLFAEIYSTKGRRLEMIDNNVIDTNQYLDR